MFNYNKVFYLQKDFDLVVSETTTEQQECPTNYLVPHVDVAAENVETTPNLTTNIIDGEVQVANGTEYTDTLHSKEVISSNPSKGTYLQLGHY